MNKKLGSRPFAVRTIAALVLLYGISMLVLTFSYANHYAEQMMQMTRIQGEEIASELRTCMDANTESVEYRNGFNLAQAAAIIRHYRYKGVPELKKMGIDFDCTLYQTVKKQGKVVSAKELRPQTPVLLTGPFSKQSGIIVFADTFNESQMKKLEHVIESGKFTTYIENARGYKEGRFFYPAEINIGEAGRKDTEIRTGYYDAEKKMREMDFQDLQVVSAEGVLTGDVERASQEESRIRENYEEKMKTYIRENGESPGGIESAGYHWVSSEYYGQIGSKGGNYVFCYGGEARPLAYAFRQLRELYLFLAAAFVILGGILIGGHNKVIERQYETEEKRRRMMDAMAHDLKTPIGIVKNYGEVLLEEEDPEKRKQYVRTVIEEADSMNEAVMSMLDLSKMEAGTYPLELSSVSVPDLAEPYLEKTRILAGRKDIKLVADLQPGERILADGKLIRGILSNFLSNALRHTEPGGTIRVSVRPEGKGVRIGVYNQGEAISAGDMTKIWNSFYRSDSARKRDGGTGLGLAIVRNACLMHGGKYGCSNEDGGVLFWVVIPSMEKGLRKAEFHTGPVLNVTGEGYRLKGMVMAAVGLCLQGLFSSMFYEAVAMEWFTDDIAYADIWPLTAIGGGFVLLGWFLILAGVGRLRKRVSGFLPLFVLTGLSFLGIGVMEAQLLWACAKDPLERPILLNLLSVLLLFLTAAQVVLLFRSSGKIAKACGDSRFYRKIQWKTAVYLLLLCLYTGLMVSGLMWEMSSYLSLFVWPGINLFAAWAWIQAYRRLNGKEPL